MATANWGSGYTGKTGKPNTGSIASKPPTYDWNAKNAYTASIPQTGQDYDSIMKAYKDLLGKAGQPNNPLNNTNALLKGKFTEQMNKSPFQWRDVNAQMESAVNSPDESSSLGTLKELSDTGGYSQQGIQDLRARGISPIRSVYANMQRNMDRNRAIQGGYSPGYGAASTRMAREASEMAAQQTSNVNAQIAEAVANNRLNAAPQYANAAQNQTNRLQGVNTRNTGAVNDMGQFNASGALNAAAQNQASQGAALSGLQGVGQSERENYDAQLRAIEGMRSLYGTTPALANTFGNQTLDFQQQQQQRQAAEDAKRAEIRAAQSGFGQVGFGRRVG